MDYELFLFSTYDEEYIAKLLIDAAKDITGKELKMEIYEGSEIYIGCGFFSVNIEIEDISNLEFIRDNYGVNVNLCINVQIYNKTFRSGVLQMLQIIGGILSQIQGDALLISNGSTQVLRREKDVLYVNNTGEFTEYPYERLGIPYKETFV